MTKTKTKNKRKTKTNTTPESMFVPNDVLNAYLYGDLYDDDDIFDSY